MPYLPTAQSFLEQSRLLVSARPTTTRISTKYTLPNPNPSSLKHKYSKAKAPSSSPPAASPSADPQQQQQQQQQQQSTKTTLTLKTYDSASGTCLKYKSDKAAEVGRLVAALANCGRVMAALPDKEEGSMEVDEPLKEELEAKVPEAQPKGKAAQKEGKARQGKGGDKGGGTGAGGAKKKKGKK